MLLHCGIGGDGGSIAGVLVLGWPVDVVPDTLVGDMARPLVGLLASAWADCSAAGAGREGTDPLGKRDCAELRRNRRALTDAAAAERRLDEALTTRDAVADIVRFCSEATGKGVRLVNDMGDVLAAFGFAAPSAATHLDGATGVDTVSAVLGSLEPPFRFSGRPVVVAADPDRGRSRRCLVVPVSVEGDPQGWLLVTEDPSSLTPSDERLARRAADYLGVELRIRQREVRTSARDRAELARRLVRGSADHEDVLGAGERLGVDTSARRIVVHVDRSPSTIDGEGEGGPAAESIARQLGTEVLAVAGPTGTTLLVATPPERRGASAVSWVKAAVQAAALNRWGGIDMVVGLSSVCEASDLSRGLAEARWVARLGSPSPRGSGPRVLAADDLGPARLFLTGGCAGAGRRYAEDVLGKLAGQQPGMCDLRKTLQAFLACGNRVRDSASVLGIHENTVRLRLDRIRRLTGLDLVRDPRHQLTAQTAMLVLDLQAALGDPPSTTGHDPDAHRLPGPPSR